MPENLQPPQSVQLIGKAGDVRSFAPSEVETADTLGYHVPTPTELQQKLIEQKYNTTNDKFMAMVEGGVDAVPFVGGVLEKALGIDPKLKQIHKELYPGFRDIGAASSIGLQSAVPASPLGLIGKAGSKVAGLAESVVPQFIGRAAGGATVGALFNAGKAVNEATLGDPNVTLEKAISQVGTGALIGGAIGGAFSLAGSMMPGASTAAGESAVAPAAQEEVQPFKSISNKDIFSGRTAAAKSSALEDAIEDVPTKTRSIFDKDIFSGKATDAVEEEAPRRSLFAEKYLYNEPAAHTSISSRGFFPSVLDGASETQAPEVTTASAPISLESPGPARTSIFHKDIFSGKGTSSVADEFNSPIFQPGEITNEIRSNVAKDLIEKAMSGAKWIKYLAAIHHPGILAGELVDKLGQFAKTAAENPEELPIFGEKLEALKVLKPIAELKDQAERQIKSAISGVFSNEKVQQAAAQLTTKLSDNVQTYEKMKNVVQGFQSNPMVFSDNLAAKTQAMYQHAPNITTAAQRVATSAVQYLAQNYPQLKQTAPMTTIKPTASQINDFARISKVVNSPLSVLPRIKNNLITDKEIEAFKTVYPNLHKDISTDLMLEIGGRGKNINYQTRLGLSRFLGTDLDGSSNPLTVASNQQIYSAPSRQADNQGVKPSQKGLSKLTLAERYKTPLQQSAERGKNV